jgi:CRISPR-associated protein Csb3
MSTVVMRGADVAVLLHHMAFYGLADILDGSGVADVRLTWDGPTPVITGADLTADRAEDALRAHLAGRRGWVDQELGPERRGLMSPRLSALKDDAAWAELQTRRAEVIDALTHDHAWPDLRYLAALGEPSYWSNPRGEARQDDGASRLEMQPRNRGSEFVGNRLRPLAARLPGRRPGDIAAALTGTVAIDELGGKPDSVSATGMTTPGPVDNALVWCALWGIGQFPIAARVDAPPRASGHLGRSRREWFVTPVWDGWWRPARLRTICASARLTVAAAPPGDVLAQESARAWLRARGVVGLARFPIGRFGSDNAPERRALRADLLAVQDSR